MEHRPIRITVPGIKKALNSYKLERAICEYIWNGFDAEATEVKVDFDVNNLGGIKELRITDNGTGIRFESLDRTFRPFFESYREFKKAANLKVSAIHGKNGVGRLTFFRFARAALWESVYSSNGGSPYRFSISVDVNSLNTYRNSTPVLCDSPTGTAVTFTDILPMDKYFFEHEVVEYLRRQFCWFLELNAPRGIRLLLNDVPLDYSALIV